MSYHILAMSLVVAVACFILDQVPVNALQQWAILLALTLGYMLASGAGFIFGY